MRWFFQQPDIEPGRSLWLDFRSGSLSTFGRIALSVVSLGAALTLALIAMAIFEEGGRLREEQAGIALCGGGLVWLLMLAWLWAGHRVVGRILGTFVIIAGIWVITIALCIMVVETMRAEELWVGALIVAAVTATVLVIAGSVYRGLRGRRVVAAGGEINVRCAECGYSMVGKSDCICPECGRTYTIDELIRLQEYDALRGQKATQSSSGPAMNAGAASHDQHVIEPGSTSRQAASGWSVAEAPRRPATDAHRVQEQVEGGPQVAH